MIISLGWLRELVSVDAPAGEIADKLSVSGLEVEHLDHWQSIKGGLKGFVIGEVVECAKHPNADKLSVTKVNIGNGELQPIVCGAPNVAAGQKVIVATVGTDVTVPGKGSFTIGEAKIRGEISRGMICAEDETGLGSAHDGIMVLPAEAKVGMAAADYFNVAEDEILEIGLTANRGDAASHLGVARDIAALFGANITLPKIDSTELQKSQFEIGVQDEQICGRYVGLEIRNVKIVPSPDFIQNRLRSIGIEPKNMVVDVTNYVLHELGQPLHAFDADKLQGNAIGVRQANAGETLVTLDKSERKLKGGELVITDASGVIAFAGVMGGLSTAVSENTQNVLLESANFHAGLVRKTARAHGLNTDASFRFERGTDIELCRFAALRAAALLVQYAGGTLGGVVDYYPAPFVPKKLHISLDKLASFAGVVIPASEAKNILQNLGYAVEDAGQNAFQVGVPSWCHGMETEADIYEEILRIYGFDRIPFSGKMNVSLPYFKGIDGYKKQEQASRFLLSNGFFEVMNNSLTSAAHNAPTEEKDMVAISNPLSSDMAFMRTSLLSGLLQAAAYNRNRKNHDIRFFEFGRTYAPGQKGTVETDKLAILYGGNATAESWETAATEMDFYFGKRIWSNLLAVLGVKGDLGIAAQAVPESTLKMYDLSGKFWFIEMDWNALLHASRQNEGLRVQSPPRFPFMRRDLSLVVDRQVPFSDLKAIIDGEKVALLKHINVFDVFEGKPLDEGKKAVAIAFYLGIEDGTLTDEIADQAMQKWIKAFESKGAWIRR